MKQCILVSSLFPNSIHFGIPQLPECTHSLFPFQNAVPMNSLLSQYNSIANLYNIVGLEGENEEKAYRCELSQKYPQASTAYLDFLTKGVMFLEEYKSVDAVLQLDVANLPGNLFDDLKRLLKVASDRMTYLKQMGFAPQVQPPKPTYVVRTESAPSNPVSPPRTTPSGNGQSPVRNDAAEQVLSPPAEESKNGLRYE